MPKDDSKQERSFKNLADCLEHAWVGRDFPQRQGCHVMWTTMTAPWKPADTSAIPRGFLFMPAFPSDWQKIRVAPFHTAGVENADSHLSIDPIRSDEPTPGGLTGQSSSHFTVWWQDPSWSHDPTQSRPKYRYRKGQESMIMMAHDRLSTICSVIAACATVRTTAHSSEANEFIADLFLAGGSTTATAAIKTYMMHTGPN